MANESGDCFGLHLNFDPNLVAEEVAKAAFDAKDYAVFPPFRRHARIWLEQDYVASMKKSSTLAAAASLRDMGDYDLDHQAWLYNKASLHAVDTLFMQIRRRLTLWERGIHSQCNAGRVWNGYAHDNQKQIGKMLTILRACRNFILPGEDKKTPAERLGLAKGPVQYEDVLYF